MKLVDFDAVACGGEDIFTPGSILVPHVWADEIRQRDAGIIRDLIGWLYIGTAGGRSHFLQMVLQGRKQEYHTLAVSTRSDWVHGTIVVYADDD